MNPPLEVLKTRLIPRWERLTCRVELFLDWFLYGKPSSAALHYEVACVTAALAVFLYFERHLLDGTFTYVHDSILWYGMYHFFGESLWNGTWAFWNPYVHGGEPFYYAWNIIRLLDPITLVTFALGKISGMALFDLYHYNYVLRVTVAMIGTYLAFRILFVRFLSAYIGLIVVMWGYLGSLSMSQVAFLDAYCWFPWIFFVTLRMLQDREGNRNTEILCLAYLWGIMIGAGIYHWAFLAYVVTVFALSLLVGHRDDLKRCLRFDRTVGLWALALFLALSSPFVALAPERSKIAPVVRIYDRDREVSWLTKVLGVDYSDIENRSPQVGLGRPERIKKFLFGFPHYEFPETSFSAKVLLVIGLLFGAHRYKKAFLVVLSLVTILFFGPIAPVGWIHKALFFSFPPLWLARHMAIFGPFMYFFLVVFIGLGADFLLSRLEQYRKTEASTGESPASPSASLLTTLGIAGATLAVAVIFLKAGPLRANFFNYLFRNHASDALLLPIILVWVGLFVVLFPIWKKVPFSFAVLIFLSILGLEQWAIGSFLHQAGKFQDRAAFEKNFPFDPRAATALPVPDRRIVGLNMDDQYMAYAPTLLKINTALEDLLPPRCGRTHKFPDYFQTKFPIGLYHFWPKPYFRLYTLGEEHPEVFAEVMGINRPLIQFLPYAVPMPEDSQEAFFRRAAPALIREVLNHAVLLNDSLPEHRSHLQSALPAQLTKQIDPIPITDPNWKFLFKESFEGSWPTGLPEGWSYSQGGIGGRAFQVEDPEFAKEGVSGLALKSSSQGPSFLRYALPAVNRFKGKTLLVRAWARGAQSTIGKIALDIQTGAKGELIENATASPLGCGEWEPLIAQKKVEPDAAYLLVTLSVGPGRSSPGYFDAVEIFTVDAPSGQGKPAPASAGAPPINPSASFPPVDQYVFSFQVRSYTSTELAIDTDTRQDGVLLYRDNDQEDWSASVDGEPVPIYRANLAFKAIPVTKGAHRVVLEYDPALFSHALYAYLAGNVAFVAWGITTWVRRRRSGA